MGHNAADAARSARPKGKKMYSKIESLKGSFDLNPKKNQRKKLISLKMIYGIDSFYE